MDKCSVVFLRPPHQPLVMAWIGRLHLFAVLLQELPALVREVIEALEEQLEVVHGCLSDPVEELITSPLGQGLEVFLT